MRILHIVPGLDERGNGIAAAARMIAARQEGAVLVEAKDATARDFSEAGEVWVHSMWTPPVMRACRRALSAGKPLVRMPHGCLCPERLSYHRLRKALVSPLERRLFRRCARIEVTCEEEREWCEAWGAEGPFELCDLKTFFRFPESAPPPPSVSGRALRVLYMGRRHPLKGLAFLEKAVDGLDAELRIETAAFGDAKEEAFGWCDVLVLPSVSENFGIVVAEALARGKFAVVTDGAPAWKDTPGTVFLEGFRGGRAADRVRLLRGALAGMIA